MDIIWTAHSSHWYTSESHLPLASWATSVSHGTKAQCLIVSTSNGNAGRAKALRSESLSPGHRWTAGTSHSSLYTRMWHSPSSDLPHWHPARKVPGTCFSPGHQRDRQGLVLHVPCHRPRRVGMLSSTKQYVNFVVQQGMPDAWPEHLGVSQESPGLPAHSEGQARQSVVVQSLHGHL